MFAKFLTFREKNREIRDLLMNFTFFHEFHNFLNEFHVFFLNLMHLAKIITKFVTFREKVLEIHDSIVDFMIFL